MLATVAGPQARSRSARPRRAQAPARTPAQAPKATFKSGLDLVVVNVVVRDKDGKLVRGLTRDDFVVMEDGKPQTVSSFDFEEIEHATLPSMATTTVLGAIAQPAAPAAAPRRRARCGRRRRHEGPAADRRSSTTSGRCSPRRCRGRCSRGATTSRRRWRRPTSSRSCRSRRRSRSIQDFTADRETLLAALNRLSPVEGSGAAARRRRGDRRRTRATRSSADDTEFNVFNTDRRLDALRRRGRRARRHRAEEVGHLLQRRGDPVGHGQPGRGAHAGGPRGPRQRLDLRRRHRAGWRRCRPAATPAQASVRGTGAFSGRVDVEPARELLRRAGHPHDASPRTRAARRSSTSTSSRRCSTRSSRTPPSYYLLGYTQHEPGSATGGSAASA
ncbi:MAG: hypothetical protein MZV63_23825 [Marinilabiliales bacterium]|nr:hypothetical protein [Marinilabiliales bacterium]